MGIGTYTFEVDGGMVTFFRSPKGSYSGKPNRMVKLAKLFTGLDSMMGRIAKRGELVTSEERKMPNDLLKRKNCGAVTFCGTRHTNWQSFIKLYSREL